MLLRLSRGKIDIEHKYRTDKSDNLMKTVQMYHDQIESECCTVDLCMCVCLFHVFLCMCWCMCVFMYAFMFTSGAHSRANVVVEPDARFIYIYDVC